MGSDALIRFRCTALRRSGATDIRIIHAGNADIARDRLIAAGLEPVSIEPVGPSLSDRLSARLHTNIRQFRTRRPSGPAFPDFDALRLAGGSRSFLAVACTLATVSITLMIGSWILVLTTARQADALIRTNAVEIRHFSDQRSNEAARIAVRPAMTSPGPTEILGRLATILPPDTNLVSASRDRFGALRLELDTPDPDQIRPILIGDPLFGGMKEIDQNRTTEGTMRVTLTGGSAQ